MKTLFSNLRSLLDSSIGERAIHAFLKHNSILLESELTGFGFCYACIPEFKLGAELRADFLLLRPDSPGWTASLVELEPVNVRLYTKRGTPTKSLLLAQNQIAEWREWIRVHESYFRTRLAKIVHDAKEPKKKQLHAEFKIDHRHDICNPNSTLTIEYFILIGRSSQHSPYELRRRSMDNRLEHASQIISYDRLLRHARILDKLDSSLRS